MGASAGIEPCVTRLKAAYLCLLTNSPHMPRLSEVSNTFRHSTKLYYTYIIIATMSRSSWEVLWVWCMTFKKTKPMDGLEPPARGLPHRRSTNWATSARVLVFPKCHPIFRLSSPHWLEHALGFCDQRNQERRFVSRNTVFFGSVTNHTHNFYGGCHRWSG